MVISRWGASKSRFHLGPVRYHKGEGLLDEYVRTTEKTKVRKRGQVDRLEASYEHRAKRRKRKTRSTQLLLGTYNSELNITNRTGVARTQKRGHNTKRRRPESIPHNTVPSGCTQFKVIAITEQHDAAGPTQETLLQWRRQGLTEVEGISRFSTDNAQSGIRTRHIYEFRAEYTDPGGG